MAAQSRCLSRRAPLLVVRTLSLELPTSWSVVFASSSAQCFLLFISSNPGKSYKVCVDVCAVLTTFQTIGRPHISLVEQRPAYGSHCDGTQLATGRLATTIYRVYQGLGWRSGDQFQDSVQSNFLPRSHCGGDIVIDAQMWDFDCRLKGLVLVVTSFIDVLPHKLKTKDLHEPARFSL